MDITVSRTETTITFHGKTSWDLAFMDERFRQERINFSAHFGSENSITVPLNQGDGPDALDKQQWVNNIADEYQRELQEETEDELSNGPVARQLDTLLSRAISAENDMHENALYDYYEQSPVRELEAALRRALENLACWKRLHTHRWVQVGEKTLCAICAPPNEVAPLYGAAVIHDEQQPS